MKLDNNAYNPIENVLLHNSIYRGSNLGSQISQDQQHSIKSATFHDMFIGDYWILNGIRWRIERFKYSIETGGTLILQEDGAQNGNIV